MPTRFLPLLCLAVLCITLSLGLWPFHAPHNQVTWLAKRNGLHFGRDSSVFSSRPFSPSAANTTSGASIEIWLHPRLIWDSGTFLSFYRPADRSVLSFRQFQTDLELKLQTNDDARHARKIHVDDVFRRGQSPFLTITSGTQGTFVYLDGTVALTSPQPLFSAADLQARMIVCDAPRQPDSWRGELFGLALYRTQLTANEVQQHYAAWTHFGRPQPAGSERNFALYLFSEHSGRIAQDRANSGVDLYIPETYQVLDKIAMQPFWTEFEMTRSYWGAALKNIVGFVPFGFSFYAWLATFLSSRRASWVTVLLGTAVSLTIEVLQAFLPTRDSGTTDIFTNTLGTWLGLVSYRLFVPWAEQVFPWISLSRKNT